MALYSRQKHVSSLTFDTIFLGGGTPSFVPYMFICRILDAALGMFRFRPGECLEISMECNPDSVSQEMVEAVMDRGVNRISLGVQAMDERDLELLGRVHGRKEVYRAVSGIRKAGIKNLGMDVIFAIPGQGRDALVSCLEEVISFGPEHLSCYELTLEKGTELEQAVASGTLSFPDEETRLDLTMALEALLEENGYRQYEISNFARPGFECRHNTGYWTGAEYLGLGCSACSFLEGRRTRNHTDLHAYLSSLGEGMLPVSEVEELGQEARFREAFVMALRMNRGVLLHEFSEIYGINPLDYYGELLEYMEENGLIFFSHDKKALALTPRGRYISNHVLSHFV